MCIHFQRCASVWLLMVVYVGLVRSLGEGVYAWVSGEVV